MSNLETLAREIYDISHLRGDFLLRSGQRSNEYFDKYRFESEPQLLKRIAEQMALLLPSNIDYLAGLEMGGIPIATALSLHTGIPVAFVRKEAKTYGTCQFAEGKNVANKRLCLIEDVITTGGQVVQSTKDLRAVGASVETVLCVIYRAQGEATALKEAGLDYRSLVTMDFIKKAVAAR
jgi:orotate phosphoribosyltransferase